MAGNPFADYLWMGDMEKFDKEIEAEIEKEFHEEEFIRSCIEQLLEEEEEQTVYYDNKEVNNSGIQEVPEVTNFNALTQGMGSLYVSQSPHSYQYVSGTDAPINDHKYVNGYSNSQPISNNASFINVSFLRQGSCHIHRGARQVSPASQVHRGSRVHALKFSSNFCIQLVSLRGANPENFSSIPFFSEFMAF